MRVAYVLAEFPRLSETFILRELLALQDLGVTIDLFALDRSREPKKHAEATQLEANTIYGRELSFASVLAAHFHFLCSSPSRLMTLYVHTLFTAICHPAVGLFALRYLPMSVTFAQIARERGVQHIHAHFAYVPADVAAAMASLLGRAFSVSAHAWDIHTQPIRALRNRLRNAAAISVCSSDGMTALRRALPDSVHDRITLIHHGVPLDGLDPSASEEGNIIAVGRLVPKKGFDVLIQACALLRGRGVPCHCTIVGDGPEHASLEATVSELELADRVTLAGALDGEEVGSLYSRATVVAHPAILASHGDREGIPNVILEAMARQLPVVASRTGGIPEVVEDGMTGYLVDPGNPGDLADRLNLLLCDAQERKRLGDAGRCVVEREFDITRNTRMLIELFERLNS